MDREKILASIEFNKNQLKQVSTSGSSISHEQFLIESIEYLEKTLEIGEKIRTSNVVRNVNET